MTEEDSRKGQVEYAIWKNMIGDLKEQDELQKIRDRNFGKIRDSRAQLYSHKNVELIKIIR